MFCTWCKKNGHIFRECRFRQRQFRGSDGSYNNASISGEQTNQANVLSNSSTENDFGYIGMATDDFNSQSGNNKIFTTSITFYINSGSSEHIVNEIPSFIKFVPLNPPKQLNLADKNTKGLESISEGSLKIVTNLNLKGILKVLYAPNTRFNLLSIKRLQEININTKFENNQVILYKNANEIKATGKSEKNELYKIFKLI